MFARLNVADDAWAVLIAFIFCACVFAVVLWRIIRMKPEHEKHLANLPLEDDPPPNPSKDG